MLPLNWLRKRYPNQIQAHVRGDGGDFLQWIRERLSHAPHGVRPRLLRVCLLASDAQARNTALKSHESYRCLLTCRNTRSLICSFFVLCFSVRLRLRIIVR
jgi:hypothetical protein